jgi:hypothetical protein
MNFTSSDLRYMANACFDEGANLAEWEVERYATELENRIGEEPTEDQVIAYAVSEHRARVDHEYASLAKFSTAAF